MLKWLKKLFRIKSPSAYFVPDDHTIMDNDFSDVEFEVEQKTNEVATIEVRDLKSYLVTEFEERKTLEEVIQSKDNLIEDLRNYKHLHDAALVMIDEYKSRLDSKDEKIKELHISNHEVRAQVDDVIEQRNTLTIQLNNLTRANNDISKQYYDLSESIDEQIEKRYLIEIDSEISRIVDQIENIMTNRVNWHKGHLTKVKMHEYINEAVEKYRGETDEPLEV